MVIVTVKSNPRPEFKENFIQAFNEVSLLVHKEEGCLEYKIYQKNATSTELFVFERWETREALDAHLATEHMKAFFTKTDKWFDGEKELLVYEVK